MVQSSQSLRIIVTGLIAQHPSLGGVAWDYVQYTAGLHALGHDVYYFEDSGEWPYNLDGGPSGDDWIAHDCTPNVTHLSDVMKRFGLEDRWAYRFPIKPRWYGLSAAKRREVVRTADMVLNISGSLKRPADYRTAGRLVYLDSDPVFTQVKLASQRGHLKFRKRVDAHDVHFTLGEQLSSTVPDTPYEWWPTRQPILMSAWAPSDTCRGVYTTVMSWTSYKPLRYARRNYCQKDVEFRKYVGLPGMCPPVRFEVALNATEHVNWQTATETTAPCEAGDVLPRLSAAAFLRQSGWSVVDARICSDLDGYRTFIQSSKGEWSVAKNGYVAGRSGWFSCRSACYLAAGRPVVVQDTGFSRVIPSGVGVLAFDTIEDAAHAIAEVEGDYARHSRAAREIAAAYFDSNMVLSRLVEDSFAAAPRASLARAAV